MGSASQFQQAASIGCYICTVVNNEVGRLIASRSHTISFKIPFLQACFSHTVPWNGSLPAKIVILPVHEEDMRPLVRFDLYPFGCAQDYASQLEGPTDSSGAASHSLYPRIAPTTGAPEAGALAYSWLRKCLDSHPGCNLRRDFVTYPPRLLDLSFENPRLVLGQSLTPSSGPYASLSHCWGPNPTFLRLTAERHA